MDCTLNQQAALMSPVDGFRYLGFIMPAWRANRVCHETGAPLRQFHGALKPFRFSSY
jgi:hypothetical protein